MKVFRIVSGLGLVVLLFSALLPWLSISFLGKYNISLSNIYSLLLEPSYEPYEAEDPSEILSSYLPGIWAIIITLYLYPIDVILSIISMVYRKVSVASGFLGIITGLLWIVGIESLKTELAIKVATEGGIFGPLFAGAVSGIITVGIGAYLTIVSGIILLTAYFIPVLRLTRSNDL